METIWVSCDFCLDYKSTNMRDFCNIHLLGADLKSCFIVTPMLVWLSATNEPPLSQYATCQPANVCATPLYRFRPFLFFTILKITRQEFLFIVRFIWQPVYWMKETDRISFVFWSFVFERLDPYFPFSSPRLCSFVLTVEKVRTRFNRAIKKINFGKALGNKGGLLPRVLQD